MRVLGINCMNHDAAMAVVDFSSGIGEVLWAAHAERYSKVKNDFHLNWAIVNEAKWQAAKVYCQRQGVGFRVLTENELFNNPKKRKRK